MDRVDVEGVKMGGEFFESGGKDFDGAFSEVVGLAVGEKVCYNRRQHKGASFVFF
jgi:hypothetical protein